MSTPFLRSFAHHVVSALVRADAIELRSDGTAQAIEDLATHLGRVRNTSLIGEIGRGLLASDAVEELFASDEDLKTLVDGLDPRAARS